MLCSFYCKPFRISNEDGTKDYEAVTNLLKNLPCEIDEVKVYDTRRPDDGYVNFGADFTAEDIRRVARDEDAAHIGVVARYNGDLFMLLFAEDVLIAALETPDVDLEELLFPIEIS